METRHNASLGATSSSLEPPMPTINIREQIKIEFYRTYDVMTGIRIAATLGGFFGLMVILVVYKSKSKTEKALEDPTLQAAAVAEAEEEERQIQAVLEATVYQQLNPRSPRRSLDISNSPANWVRSTRRFSAIGGYSSLTEPTSRTLSRLPSFIDEDYPPDEDEFDGLSTYDKYLDVPRRSSNITCSSSDSSYLERRGSAVILGLPAVPAHKFHGRRRLSSPVQENYDFYYPIDIRVIQPTPGGSPCGSERALYDTIPPNVLAPRRAPLASISSCNSSLGTDCGDLDAQSCVSDSVFYDGSCIDTDDEVDPFSTDSETSESFERGAWCRRGSKGSAKRRLRHTISEKRTSVCENIPFAGERMPIINESKSSLFESLNSKEQLLNTDDKKLSTSIDQCCPSVCHPTTDAPENIDEHKPSISDYRWSISECSHSFSEQRPSFSEGSIFQKGKFSLSEQSSILENNTIDRLNSSDQTFSASDSKLTVAEFHPTTALSNPERALFNVHTNTANSPAFPSNSLHSSTVTLPTFPLTEPSLSGNLDKQGTSWSQETLF